MRGAPPYTGARHEPSMSFRARATPHAGARTTGRPPPARDPLPHRTQAGAPAAHGAA